jgi:hypothetical protein
VPVKKKSARKAIAALSAEMSLPHITTSALRVLHHLAPHSRKLDFIDPFHGHACSWCGCRFPESRPPQGNSAAENLLLQKFHREKQFSRHVCSERPTAKSKH